MAEAVQRGPRSRQNPVSASDLLTLGIASALRTTAVVDRVVLSLQFPPLAPGLECCRAELRVCPGREKRFAETSFSSIISDFCLPIVLTCFIGLFGIFTTFEDVECISLNHSKTLQWSTLHRTL